MKKIILIFVLLLSTIVAQAATYRVKFDVGNQKETNFIVKVEPGRLTVDNKSYSLRRLGTITNSGVEFNSYVYGRNEDGMFCVSTTSITLELNMFKSYTGYVIIIDNKAYIAKKIN